jgi:hypothetical protein
MGIQARTACLLPDVHPTAKVLQRALHLVWACQDNCMMILTECTAQSAPVYAVAYAPADRLMCQLMLAEQHITQLCCTHFATAPMELSLEQVTSSAFSSAVVERVANSDVRMLQKPAFRSLRCMKSGKTNFPESLHS